jgi:hypothetical protein
MGLDGLLVVVRTFPDGAVSGSSWQASFAILHVVTLLDLLRIIS